MLDIWQYEAKVATDGYMFASHWHAWAYTHFNNYSRNSNLRLIFNSELNTLTDLRGDQGGFSENVAKFSYGDKVGDRFYMLNSMQSE